MRASRGLLVVLFCVACPAPSHQQPESGAPVTTAPPPLEPLFAEGDPHHGAFEAPELPNACAVDGDCHRGGCGDQVCSAQLDVMTICVALPVALPQDAACGCLSGSCQWSSPSGAAPVDATKGDLGATSSPCAELLCSPPAQCIEYYGIAGPNGNKYASCEVKCTVDGTCPEGMRCITIADGPGRVCHTLEDPQPEPGPSAEPTHPEPGKIYDLVVSFGSPGDGTDRDAYERVRKVIEGTSGLETATGYWGKEGEHDECFMLTHLSDPARKKFRDEIERATRGGKYVHVASKETCRHERR